MGRVWTCRRQPGLTSVTICALFEINLESGLGANCGSRRHRPGCASRREAKTELR